jgi:hypothetical protein
MQLTGSSMATALTPATGNGCNWWVGICNSNFGTLDSITATPVNGVDGAIVAGVTMQTTPEPASVLLLGTCLAVVAFLLRRRFAR